MLTILGAAFYTAGALGTAGHIVDRGLPTTRVGRALMIALWPLALFAALVSTALNKFDQ